MKKSGRIIRQFMSLFLCMVIAVGSAVPSFAEESGAGETPPSGDSGMSGMPGSETSDSNPVIINQVYGGSSSEDAVFTHSFIELFNNSGEPADLSGYTVDYSVVSEDKLETVSFDLSGSIPGYGSYLIRCGATGNTSAENPSSAYDAYWEQKISAGEYQIVIKDAQSEITDAVAVGESPLFTSAEELPFTGDLSAKSALRRTDFKDTDNNSTDFVIVDYSELNPYMLPKSTAGGAWTLIKDFIITIGATSSDINATWFSTTSADSSFNFDKTEYPVASAESAEEGWYSNKVSVSGLTDGITYEYTYSTDGITKSGSYTPHTDTEDGFSFIVVGDPQIGASRDAQSDADGWYETLDAALGDGTNYSFIYSMGDQVEKSTNSEQYSLFLDYAGLKNIALAPTVGNHDSKTDLYADHFTTPNTTTYGVTADGKGDGDYWFVYGDVLFMTLNTNNKSVSEHQQFMEEAISANPDAKWKVSVFHHSLYSVASHVSDVEDLRVSLAPVLNKLDIDVVLQGHDHVYARSYIMGGSNDETGMTAQITESDLTNNDTSSGLSVINEPDGVQYVTFNSASGSKFYNITSEAYQYTEVMDQSRMPNYSRVTVTDNAFTVSTYKINGEEPVLVDDFTITKGIEFYDEKQAEGFENSDADLKLTQIGRYDSGSSDADGGVMEIVSYNKKTQFAYAINGKSGVLTSIPMEMLEDSSSVQKLRGSNINISALISGIDGDFIYGDMTSVAISPDGGILAAALQDERYDEPGRAALFECNSDGTLTYKAIVTTGVQPDMITFTPDGTKILTANEGEPRDGIGTGVTDPLGTVSIINVSDLSVVTADFTEYDSHTYELTAQNILLGMKNDAVFAPSVDFDPEYITCTDNTAYVSLQEANAIAVLDIQTGRFSGIYSVGYENYSSTAVDLFEDGKYLPATYENLIGARMPDGIALYTAGDTDYILTANEGDAREWGSSENEFANETSKTVVGMLGDDTVKMKLIDNTACAGLPEDKNVCFGGRSFTLFKVTDSGLEEIYDSGSDFESATAEYLGKYFNCSNDDTETDSRSAKKGPEPESVTVGSIGSKTYAFITLERIGGIMVYDITDTANILYVNYINSRNFNEDIGADDSPEGIYFISDDVSPTGNSLLLAACEAGGTVAAYNIEKTASSGGPSNHSGSSSGGGSMVKYTLSFNTNGGSDIAPIAKTRGTRVGLDEYVPIFDGYIFDGWYLDSDFTENISSVTITNNTTVYAKWTKENTSPNPANETSSDTELTKTSQIEFKDINSSDYFYDAVVWAVEKNIVKGITDAEFGAEYICTRAQAVTFLWRASGSPQPQMQINTFSDIPEDAYYRDAVAWANENGIVLGVSDTEFAPDKDISRAQIAAMLWRAAGSPDSGANSPFTDVSDTKAYYYNAVAWASSNETALGTDENTFGPDTLCSRSQIVTFLFRYFG